VVSGRGFCVGLITRPEESTVCGESECNREVPIVRRPWPTRGCCAMETNLGYVFCDVEYREVFLNIYWFTRYEGTVPPARYEGTVSPARYEGTVPPARYEGTVSPARYEGTVPPARYEGTVPPARYEGTVPPARYEGTVPTARYEGTVPPARYEGTVPPALYEGTVPPARRAFLHYKPKFVIFKQGIPVVFYVVNICGIKL